MAFKPNSSITVSASSLTNDITGDSGSTITLDKEHPEEYELVTSGSVTLSSSLTITSSASGSGDEGTVFRFKISSDITLNGNTLTILGASIDEDLLNKENTIEARYDGSSWTLRVFPDFEQNDIIEQRHLKDNTVGSNELDSSNVAGDGLTDNSGKLDLEPDTNNGTSLEKGTDGARLDGDENSPSNFKVYGVNNSSNKGWLFIDDLLTEYDSGWKNIADYDSTGTHGLYDLTNQSQPQYRIIGRTVFLRGVWVIPIDDGGIVTDQDNYPTTTSATTETTASGNNVVMDDGIGAELESPPLFNDSDLHPESHTQFVGPIGMRRRIQESNSSKVIALDTISAKFEIMTDGKIRLTSVGGFESPKASVGDSSSQLQTSSLRHLCTVANVNDYILDWTNYRSSHDGTNFMNSQEKGAEQFPFTLNTTDAQDWGGFAIDLSSFFYILDDATTLETIKSKA